MPSTISLKRRPRWAEIRIRGVPEDRRRALEELRATIHSIVPEAQERISYRMPAFRLDGAVIAGFSAT
ncbi:MAG: DUF1801 domain-containing protein, partial [Burkholderiales bacterium]|nr:DUF1801 domain-containing protein [Burkholderiales bacterium]